MVDSRPTSMHIGMFLPYFEGGGTERHVVTLIKALLGDHRVTLAAPEGPYASIVDDLPISRVVFTRLDQGLVRGWRSLRRGIRELAASDAPDIFHVHGAHELLLALRGQARSRPIVFTAHGYHGSGRGISYRTAAWAANRYADQVIAVSRYERDLMQGYGFDPGRLHLIPNGVEDPTAEPVYQSKAEAREALGIDPDRWVVGAVARLEASKGLEWLIRAMARLASRDADHIQAVIVGTGGRAGELKALAKSLAVEDRVRFAGYVQDAAAAMTAFDVFAHPALEEPFGLVCAEAMANALPVVASEVGGIPEIVVDGETGVLTPPGRDDLLAEAIWRLARDPRRASALGEAGRMRYVERFSAQAMVERTVRVYERALSLG